MPEMHNVIAKVISQKGECSVGHRVGDEFIVGQTTPEGMCAWAFCALFQFAVVLQSGSSFPWEAGEGKTTVACPDPENPLVFELRRLEM